MRMRTATYNQARMEGLFFHDLADQIPDLLHYGEIGLPKTAWKHGVLPHAPDDGRREKISDALSLTTA